MQVKASGTQSLWCNLVSVLFILTNNIDTHSSLLHLVIHTCHHPGNLFSCSHPSTPTSPSCVIALVGWRLYWQGGACFPRSPPPRTRHLIPPPLQPRPEWVPPIYTLTHSYTLPPPICFLHHTSHPISIHHILLPYWTKMKHSMKN